MTTTPREAFLAGDRPDDILVFLSEDAVGNPDALGGVAEAVEGGVVLVMPGDRGRSTFEQATGIDPMDFAGVAMQTDGHVDRDCAGGDCPATEAGAHDVKFVFAFAEEQNEEVGGLYAEGDVIHAYASCSCGETYSDKWVVDDSD
ncbi:DUF5807 family protein [Halorarius halobius]|uniref:DUF5807 family protein n=1 Tax=Halorarius halobius TaxID=2962671 RepID=UPI0020CE5D12|nr:DUF5807 family protein [Halorarius halobius]